MLRITRLAIVAVALLILGLIGGSAASPSSAPTRQDAAKKILASPAGNTLTAPARAYMESVARNDHRLAPDSNGIVPPRGNKINSARPGGGGSLVNVRVNNPANDTHQIDQTTQSETTVAVSGSNVVVGYNTSQHTLLFLTAASNLAGYAYSTDGGLTFTDGGVVPNAPGNVNLGDPWLAVDSGGKMYYSNLTIEGTTGAFLVGVARSADSGKTWTPAAPIAPSPPGLIFYASDKDALTTGPGTGNLYDAWDDFQVDSSFNFFSGLPVAHSADGGQTWSVSYATKVPLLGADCSFNQYIGAQPLVVGNTIYDAAELITGSDPGCTGFPTFSFSEAVFVSPNGGSTWSAGAVIPITSSTQGSRAFVLAPGQYMRNLEFPTLASFKGSVYMAWNDGGDGSGHSHIRLAQIDGSGGVRTSWVTSGTNDEAQPALTSDSGLHVAYYQLSSAANGNGQLDVIISNSNNGNTWKPQRVTSQSFPGVFNVPQFDPIVAFGYMGDYIAAVSDGLHQYMAWGDNRDIVNNFLWPNGRNDPDVFFAKQ